MAREELKLQGSMVALVTPFKNGKVDRKAFQRLLDFHLKEGTDVLIPCGTTGESATLSHEEHRDLMTFTVEYVNGRVPVICGAGSNNTEEALGLIKHARKIGARGVLVVTPYYNKPTQEGLYRHYEYLAAKVDIPIVLYNVPGRTGVSMAPATVARLAKIPQIVAIKEASGSLEQVEQIMELCPLTVISGDDALTLPMMAVGAKGVISVAANVAPGPVREMVRKALDGQYGSARGIHRKLYPIFKTLFIETNPIPVKTALGMMGLITPELRMPLCPMSPANEKTLREALVKADVLK
jgi:4-hydroxy-tetrahydrodipicolinate synthase